MKKPNRSIGGQIAEANLDKAAKMTKKQMMADLLKSKEKPKIATSQLTEMVCVLTIPKAEVKKMQSILDGPKLTSKQMQVITGETGHDTIKSYTAEFANPNFNTEMVMDIKVCNGDTPFVDAVLFDDGAEVDYEDTVRSTLLGEYITKDSGVAYKVIVKEA